MQRGGDRGENKNELTWRGGERQAGAETQDDWKKVYIQVK